MSSAVFQEFRSSFLFNALVVSSHACLAIVKLSALSLESVPVWLQLLPTAISCILIGSAQAVIDPTSEQGQEVERMKPEDAYKFPVIGSMTLFTFYLCIKKLPKNMVEMITRVVFCVLGGLAMHEYFGALAQKFLPQSIQDMTSVAVFSFCLEWKTIVELPFDIVLQIPIPRHSTMNASDEEESKDEAENEMPTAANKTVIQSIDMDRLDFVTFPLGFVVSGWWYLTAHWMSNNLIGESFCMQAIALMNPGSFFTGAVLLALLFVYDIFWVFGTEVMVTVAKGLKGPIKLEFPRGGDNPPSALGLGDIVLPGIYLALLLKYDVVRKQRGSVPQTFLVGVICYMLSLGICLFVMFYFEHAQPALLYISPGVTLPVMAFAAMKGEFKDLWGYEEEDHAKQS